jgi:ABC-2 type transport system ATP-binding protein
VSFRDIPADWRARLDRLPGVEHITEDGHIYRITSSTGPATTLALMTEATAAGVSVQSLAVQSTTLDDVFVHYTGRDLRDALQPPSALDRHPMLRR